MTPYPSVPQRSVSVAYMFWLAGFVGFCGAHRIYSGKVGSGLLWLFTFGLFGIGQFIDLFLIPGMVEEFNFKQKVLAGAVPASGALPPPPPPKLVGQSLMREIIKLAQYHQGVLTIPQAIAEIDADFDDIEKAFNELVKRDYAQPENNIVTGAIEYRFSHLEGRRS